MLLIIYVIHFKYNFQNKCNMFFYYVHYIKQVIKFMKYEANLKVIKIYILLVSIL